MTNNTTYANNPSTWDVGAVAAGADFYYRVTPGYSPTAADVLVWHWCTADGPGRWLAKGLAAHTLVAVDPLHIEPSLRLDCCDLHGFIRAGRWEPA